MAAGAFSFLHAADLHLDSPLRGLGAYPGAPVERLRGATREAFDALVEEALERRVAFLLLAGDLFDGDWPDYESGLWFLSRLRRLAQAGIATFLVQGNHDAESRVTRKLRWPDGVTAFGDGEPGTVVLEELGVAVHGWSYDVPHVAVDPVPRYPAPHPGLLNVGLLHTGLEGYAGHGRYAPCTLQELVQKGYDYWALGHVHAREELCRAPWVVFPGNLQGRHARECGPRGATLVHVEDGVVRAVEPLVLDVVRWARVDVDLAGVDDRQAALARVDAGLRVALEEASGRLLAARVVLGGATALDDELRATPQRTRAEVRARGADAGPELWIEKVLVETRPDGEDAPGEGLSALAARLRGARLDGEEAAALAAELERLAARLPEPLATELAPGDPARVAAAVDPARRYLAALLSVHGAADEAADAEDGA